MWRKLAYKRQFTVSSTCFFSGTRLAVYLPVHHNSHPKVPSSWWVCELHWTVGTGDPTNNRHQVSLEFFKIKKKTPEVIWCSLTRGGCLREIPTLVLWIEKKIVFFCIFDHLWEVWFRLREIPTSSILTGKAEFGYYVYVVAFVRSSIWVLLYLYRDMIPF